MKTALRYLAASVALLIALAPVYWLITISLKREVDQFAVSATVGRISRRHSSITLPRSAADRLRCIF